MAQAKSRSGPRAIWKGAISFGLVHVPVGLFSATQEQEVDFDWLDKRTMDPVGYKRINKRTGKEIGSDNIVKGVKLEGGDYVVVSDDEIKAAYPKRTQIIAIETFVKAVEVSFVYTEKPYYLAPDAKAERVYALLRDALAKSAVIGIARFVLHNKEHLTALIPAGPALMLGTLRWANELRSADELDLPKQGAGAGSVKPAELKMAQQLINEMASPWKPQDYEDDFTRAIHELVKRKAKAGKTEMVQPFEQAPDIGASNVVDLTELLRNSLGAKARAKAPERTKPVRKATARTAAKKSARAPAKSKSAGSKKAA